MYHTRTTQALKFYKSSFTVKSVRLFSPKTSYTATAGYICKTLRAKEVPEHPLLFHNSFYCTSVPTFHLKLNVIHADEHCKKICKETSLNNVHMDVINCSISFDYDIKCLSFLHCCVEDIAMELHAYVNSVDISLLSSTCSTRCIFIKRTS